MSNTFQNLAVLKKAQADVKIKLGNKYDEVVSPYVEIIQMVMKSNDIDAFKAILRIKETLPLYKRADAPFLFSAAIIDIIEAKHFQGFEDKIKTPLN